ncbi:hypothetical protein AVEN_187193-1 [Araneus ventricosus]|uniref:Tc1-like transposase DDE domain-containing protein n=1 Tax=Araneus ventricosus TaxID=182803 RepID=A0A4Y2MI44_ARAVE|nr:hypothetical protein AVEN_187193-1 [Araneus ventricosus]
MLSDGVILLHDNTHTSRKTQELLRKLKWEVWSHYPHSPDSAPIWVPDTYLEQGALNLLQREIPNASVKTATVQQQGRLAHPWFHERK